MNRSARTCRIVVEFRAASADRRVARQRHTQRFRHALHGVGGGEAGAYARSLDRVARHLGEVMQRDFLLRFSKSASVRPMASHWERRTAQRVVPGVDITAQPFSHCDALFSRVVRHRG
jgi:hypothetical protein